MLPTLLIVDDDPLCARAMARRLRSHFQISIALGAHEALRDITAHPPDVLMVELHLDQLRAGRLLGWVSEHHPTIHAVGLTWWPEEDVPTLRLGLVQALVSKLSPLPVLVNALSPG